jgi:hypothetical protein
MLQDVKRFSFLLYPSAALAWQPSHQQPPDTQEALARPPSSGSLSSSRLLKPIACLGKLGNDFVFDFEFAPFF